MGRTTNANVRRYVLRSRETTTDERPAASVVVVVRKLDVVLRIFDVPHELLLRNASAAASSPPNRSTSGGGGGGGGKAESAPDPVTATSARPTPRTGRDDMLVTATPVREAGPISLSPRRGARDARLRRPGVPGTSVAGSETARRRSNFSNAAEISPTRSTQSFVREADRAVHRQSARSAPGVVRRVTGGAFVQ